MNPSPLLAMDVARGARLVAYQECEIVAEYAGLQPEYQALREGAGLIDLSARGRLRIVGPDRRRWLHGMVTQDITGLADGRGAYAAVLNPQGHMIADMRVFALPDALLCDLPPSVAHSLPKHLDAYLYIEDAEIQDVREEVAQLSLQGPNAVLSVAACLGVECAEIAPWQVCELAWQETTVTVARVTLCGEDGFDLFVPASHAPRLYACVSERRREFGLHPVGLNALNHRRIEAGIPWWGHELDTSVVPFAARLEQAVSLTKGCYVGQEIIARLDARGQVNNLLCGLTLQGNTVPADGAEVWTEDRKVGRVTSAVRSPALDRVIGLGYVRREVACVGTELQVRAAGGEQGAVVTELPFIPNPVGQSG